MERKRVLLINDYGSPDGGAERQMLRLRDGLRRRGHDVILLASSASTTPGAAPSQADVTCFGTNSRLQGLTQSFNPAAALAVRRTIASLRPEVVHVRMFLWQLSPLIVPSLRGTPAIYHAAQYKSICPTGSKMLPDGRRCTFPAGRACLRESCVTPMTWSSTMAQLAMFRHLAGRFDRVVALSEAMRELLARWGIDRPIEVVPNGVAERPGRPPLAEPPTAFFAGRLTVEKGLDVLIDAFAHVRQSLPQARLVLAGEGPLAPALRARVKSLDLADSVDFTGHLAREAMERRADAAWVQATPSRWEEPFGNVSTEAMMRGTAVVASAVGGQSEIVRDGETGFLVQAEDDRALAARLGELLHDRARCERMGARGREIALRDFSEAAVLDRFETIYEELAHARANDGRGGIDAPRRASGAATPW